MFCLAFFKKKIFALSGDAYLPIIFRPELLIFFIPFDAVVILRKRCYKIAFIEAEKSFSRVTFEEFQLNLQTVAFIRHYNDNLVLKKDCLLFFSARH